MKHILSALAFSGLLALGVTTVATPTSASPVSLGAATVNAVETVGSQSENVVNIDHRRHHFGPGPARPPWYRGGGRHHHHHRHRGHNGWGWGGPGPWGPPWWDRPRSNFTFELNVQPRPRYSYRAPRYALSAPHVQWCESRYRSYRVSDNTFQPYNGPRRQCVSPYD